MSNTNALAGRLGGLKKSINRLKLQNKSTTALEQHQAEVEAEMTKMRGNRSNDNRNSGRDSENDLFARKILARRESSTCYKKIKAMA